jgi:GNS1/SUR4 family
MDQFVGYLDQLYLLGERCFEHRELLMSWEPLVAALVGYLALVLVGPRLVGDRELVDKTTMRAVMFVHNAFLCGLSLVMASAALYGAVVVVNPVWGWHESLCNLDGTLLSGAMWGWCWIFYASKYYELVDTVILILNRKPLILLHVWHHLSVMVLCYFFVHSNLYFFYTGVIVNGTIHVIMYSYYALSSIGYRAPWAKLITMCQIVQFVYGIGIWWYWLANCHSAMNQEQWIVFFANQFVLTSFLVLFMLFFKAKYNKKPAGKSAQQKRTQKKQN